MTYGTVSYDATTGAAFTISEQGDAPTMQSNFYIFFGEITVEMQTAPGTGIVSCAILESDVLDEVDFEWIGGTATSVESNYFGKGNTTLYNREQWTTMADSQADFHNYTFKWTEETLEWLIDGTSVRSLAYADALGGENYPQTPMRVKLGTWAGGDSDNSYWTIQWAGGETDYSEGPFTAYIKSVSIVNYNPATEYTYGDTSGSYDSIEITGGNSSSVAESGSELSCFRLPIDFSQVLTTIPAATSSANTSSVEGTTSSSEGTSSNTTTAASSSSGSATSGSSGDSSSSSSSSSSNSSSSASAASSSPATAGATSWGPDMAFFTTVLSMLGFAVLLA